MHGRQKDPTCTTGNNGAGIAAARSDFLASQPKKLVIGGEFVEAYSGETFDTINPATGDVLAVVARGGVNDIHRAVAAARQAFESRWRRFGPYERQRLLLDLASLIENNADELALIDAHDMGQPLVTLKQRIEVAVSILRWFSGQARSIKGETIENSSPGDFLSYTLKEPVGVVGAITPWNSPFAMAVWKLAPVLATGCTLVLKPSEQSPLSALRLAELCLEAGVPEGVVNVVTGYGDVGAALASHVDVDKIAFTGSVATGQQIVKASATNVKRLSLELGGKSPDIVFADADMDAATATTALAMFGNSGQNCIAPSRLFIERRIYDEVVARVAEIGDGLSIGDPLDPSTDLGPVVSRDHLQRVLRYIEIGRDEGAQVISGGERVSDKEHVKGYYIRPTVFSDVRDDMRIAQEEIFGPVVAAFSFDNLDEVARRSNATQFGLGAGIWTSDVRKAHRLASQIRAGSVWVNTYAKVDPAVPFGGYKMSGYGRELGVQHMDEYLNVKSCWIKTS